MYRFIFVRIPIHTYDTIYIYKQTSTNDDIYRYMHEHIYVCIQVDTSVYVNIDIQPCTGYIHTDICARTYLHPVYAMRVHICACMYACMCARTYVRVYVCMYVRTHVRS